MKLKNCVNVSSHPIYEYCQTQRHVLKCAKCVLKYCAFTLAEVLITLGIIGIVASLTLPSVFNKSQNKALEAALKKNYSVIQQALDLYQAENGERLKPEFLLESSDLFALKNNLMPYMKVIRDCGLGYDDTDKSKVCIKNSPNADERSLNYKTFNDKSSINLNMFDDGQFVTSDGALILIDRNIHSISVDVNGFNKKPNRLGRDLFMFQLDEKGMLRPMGVQGTHFYSDNDEYCSKISSNSMNGAGCTYKALTDKNYFNEI